MLPGVEINVGGVHILAYFPHPPCEKTSYGEGIKTFLATLGVYNIKTDGALSLAQGTVKEVIDKLLKQHAVFIFAHCNSDNGLFQERGRTDRTHLAEIFNHSSPIVLQCHTKAKAEELAAFIRTKPALQSAAVITIASDGRALRDYGRSDDGGNYCFIKGSPTVEGLRQASYEPTTRILLGATAPIPPIHRLDRIDLSFPEGTKLNDDSFCFAGDQTITFSPNYTCLIGGRGTGKSTLLNLLQEKIKPRSNTFFASRKLTSIEGKSLVTTDYLKIDDDTDKKSIDFLSQNEIERFATDSKALTTALYSRLEKENQGKLKKSQDALELSLAEFQAHIEAHQDKLLLTERISDLEKERQSQEKILKSFQSEQYKNLSAQVAADSTALRNFQVSRSRLTKLVADIDRLLPQKAAKEDNTDPKNDYDILYEKVVTSLREAKLASDSLDKEKLAKYEEQLEKSLQDSKALYSRLPFREGPQTRVAAGCRRCK